MSKKQKKKESTVERPKLHSKAKEKGLILSTSISRKRAIYETDRDQIEAGDIGAGPALFES